MLTSGERHNFQNSKEISPFSVHSGNLVLKFIELSIRAFLLLFSRVVTLTAECDELSREFLVEISEIPFALCSLLTGDIPQSGLTQTKVLVELL